MSQLVLSRGTVRRNFFRKLLPDVEVGPYFLISSLIIFVVLVTVITLMSSTRQVTKGYVLNQLEAKHQDLIKQNEQREMEISVVRSLQYIEGSSKVKRMVRPGQVVFIGGETVVASK